MRLKRLLGGTAAMAGGVVAGWFAFARVQGDALMTFEPPALTPVATVGDDPRTFHGEITVVNRGKAGGVVHKVEGRVVDGPPGRVLATRQGSRPPERGWWVSNILGPGESCVAEVDVELEEAPAGPVIIELDLHEVARRLKVHRTVQLAVPAPSATPAS